MPERYNPDDPFRMTPRRWVAWKLVQLAHRLYDASSYTVVKFADGGDLLIEDSEYGSGIQASTGLDGHLYEFETFDEAIDFLDPPKPFRNA